MPFGKFVQKKTLPRHWALIGYATHGKSTFAGNMKGPIVVIDTDNRFVEVSRRLGLAEDHAMPISNERDAHIDADKIASILSASKGEQVGTILVDSLTGIIQPKITKAMTGGDGANKARGAAMNDKAMTMRKLVDSLQNYGSDYLLIWHTENRRDQKGAEVIHQTLPPTERDALYRALNMVLVAVVEEDRSGNPVRFGIRVDWSRNGKSGMVIWDDPGNFFRGMPEKIEAAVYADGAKVDTFGGADSVPEFKDMASAINWAIDLKAYPNREEARADYAKLKEETNPTSAQAMFNAWIPHVKARAGQFPDATS